MDTSHEQIRARKFGFRSLRCLKIHEVKDPSISVLVRVKNEISAITPFLQTLRQQSIFAKTEVIFLDSGSTDGTVEKLMAFSGSVYAIDSSEFMFGPTCNLLCSLANAEFLSLMSGHIEITGTDTLERALAFLKAAPAFSAAYFRQIPNESLGASSYERAQLRWNFPNGVNPVMQSSQKHVFSNAASLFNANIWRKIPFPAVTASEDYLWIEKVLEAGGHLFYLPHLVVRHSHNETPEQLHRRVVLNVEARPHNNLRWPAAIKYFCGVSVACLLYGAGPVEAFKYAKAHGGAYLKSKRITP